MQLDRAVALALVLLLVGDQVLLQRLTRRIRGACWLDTLTHWVDHALFNRTLRTDPPDELSD